jgi:acetyltransferase-like isoleucine patch superfamily enzyme
MPIQIIGNIDENHIDAYPGFLEETNGLIQFEGVGNKLRIGKIKHIGHLDMSLRHGSLIDIGEGQYVSHFSVHAAAGGSSIKIGENNYFNGRIGIFAQEKLSITIGADCLFATDCEITGGDFHGIFDVQTGERINLPRDIFIEDHVWFGSRVTVLKGAHIGRDSVVGMGSIVTGRHLPGCVLAGIPARVIRTGVTWQR